MAIYREPEEISMNVLQVCEGQPLKISHIAQKARLNAKWARRFTSELVQAGYLQESTNGFKTTWLGNVYAKQIKFGIMIVSKNCENVERSLNN